jgi:two-component system, LuxR family, sensor kinase FixL
MREPIQNDALFRTLIATAVDGIMVIDERGSLIVYNAACERLFGYRPEEVMGENVKMLMPSPYRQEHDGYLAHYRETGEKRIIGIGREVVAQRKDGSTFPMYLSVGEGVLDGQRIFVGIIHDLTGRYATARRMQDLQNELLHVSRLSAMGQMTAAIAHELNQPLTAILNYINAARRTIAPLNDAQAVRVAELVEKAANQTSRAGQIIRQLRDFVEKRESARFEVSPNKVVEEAIALAAVGSADANVKTFVQLAPNLPLVLIDKIQIQQVIINLIRNSIEAMQSEAKRELRIMTSGAEGGGVRLDVRDSGPGLSPEVASRLFHPFVTTKEKGMGIGLSICHSIVEAHGGRIWATSNDSGGVTFHVQLPPSPVELT